MEICSCLSFELLSRMWVSLAAKCSSWVWSGSLWPEQAKLGTEALLRRVRQPQKEDIWIRRRIVVRVVYEPDPECICTWRVHPSQRQLCYRVSYNPENWERLRTRDSTDEPHPMRDRLSPTLTPSPTVTEEKDRSPHFQRSQNVFNLTKTFSDYPYLVVFNHSKTSFSPRAKEKESKSWRVIFMKESGFYRKRLWLNPSNHILQIKNIGGYKLYFLSHKVRRHIHNRIFKCERERDTMACFWRGRSRRTDPPGLPHAGLGFCGFQMWEPLRRPAVESLNTQHCHKSPGLALAQSKGLVTRQCLSSARLHKGCLGCLHHFQEAELSGIKV